MLRMRNRTVIIIASLAAVLAACVPPWLAFQESKRQAYRIEADMAIGYALDVLRRGDDTARQALSGIEQLKRSGFAPCSAESQALMREIDLTSTYIQAIGHVRDGVFTCSSMGTTAASLGTEKFVTTRGVILHTSVPLGKSASSPLIGVEAGEYAALFHRDLPLDTWTAVSDVSLAVLHLEVPRNGVTMAQRGFIDRAWLTRLGKEPQVVFIDGNYLVVVARSKQFLTAGIAAVPLAHLHKRTAGIAVRLVPAGMLAGFALGAVILLLGRRQISMANALRQALRNKEFFLLYQPIIALDSGKCVGVEALVRWRRSGGRLVGPDLFIPIAEDSGIITKLTATVLDLVAEDVGTFLAEHPDFHIAINLSASDLQSDRIVGQIDRLIARTNARPANFIVEITERAFVDADAARKVIGALRARGIEVAIDDFGTGYSSLSYLETLEIDYLKIDRSFIETIGTTAPTSQVVGHIIDMARTMGLRMVAEGVENELQAQFLRARQVQYAQGWLFGRPAPFAAATLACAANDG